MKIALSVIRERARNRPSGYLDDVMAVATIVGQDIEISVQDLRALKVKYRPPTPEAVAHEGCTGCNKAHLHE